eukprot:m.156767 g.156767  ORF g.156767 m.156767 type:complete len:420 (+) comp15158_c0_seq5:995-2254(+)
MASAALTRCQTLVIGGGVVGIAVARALSRRGVDVMLVERNADLLDGVSGRNTGIVCTGYDAPQGSIELACLRRSLTLLPAVLTGLNIPHANTGALVVARSQQEAKYLPEIVDHNARVGDAARLLTALEVKSMEPRIAPTWGAVFVPGEITVDSFLFPLALLLDAIHHGTRVRRACAVTAAKKRANDWLVETSHGPLVTKIVINCAGLHADHIAALVEPPPFMIRPRMGEYLVFPRPPAPLIARPIQPVPTDHTKGIYVFPTLHGHLVAGPTAVDVDPNQRDQVAQVSRESEEKLLAVFRETLPDADATILTRYVGLRPATNLRDYQIRWAQGLAGWLHVAGIRSTGLSASLGIGEHVAAMVFQSMYGANLPADTASLHSSLPSLADIRAQCQDSPDGSVRVADQSFRVTHPLSRRGLCL